MRILRLVILGILTSLLAFPLAAQSTESCSWSTAIARDWVRSPIQMDIHAAYRILVFKSDGTVGYTLRGQYPYAAFMSFTIYDHSLLYAAITDYQIKADQGSINPFQANELVNAPNRSYSVTVLPDGIAPDTFPNPISMPPLPAGSSLITVVLVQRIYLPEPKLKDRFGGVDAPTIEPFYVSTRTPAACPTLSDDASAITTQFGSVLENFNQSPLPRDGKIEFYRPPASLVPFADGSSPLTKQDCTSYLMATVYPDKLAIVHVPDLPTFFDNRHVTKKTVFVDQQVRYISMGSYGATPLGIGENENVADADIQTLHDGSANFVAIPIRLLLFDTERASEIKKVAQKLGYNVMPLADYGPLIPLYLTGPWINPFLIYRNKVPATGFSGSILNVKCYQGSNFGEADSSYAASPDNMKQFAPVGIECSVSDFLYGSCGHNF